MMSEKDKIEVMSMLGDIVGEFLVERLPDGMEKNKVIGVKDCKDIVHKLTSIAEENGMRCEDPEKVEKALRLFQEIHSLLDEFDEEPVKEEEDEAVKILMEKFFSD